MTARWFESVLLNRSERFFRESRRCRAHYCCVMHTTIDAYRHPHCDQAFPSALHPLALRKLRFDSLDQLGFNDA